MVKFKFCDLLKHVTVEPTVFLYEISYTMVETTNQNLLLQKTCRFDTTAEPNLSTPCDDEKRGVVYASEMNSTFRFVTIFVCMLVSIFATIWSDEAGIRRRPLIYLPAFAMILQSLSGCLHSYFWHWPAVNAVLSDMVLEIIGGGTVLMYIITRLYICDVSSPDSRTMRMGIHLSVKMTGVLIASSTNGFILRRLGFFYTYLLCAVLATGALFFALIFVEDISVAVSKTKSCWRFLSFMQIVDSFKIVFRKSLGKKRIVVLLLLIICVVVIFSTFGERTVLYLYFRYRFHWNEEDFSSYVFYRHSIAVFGTIFSSVVLSKWLKIHDGLIGAFAASWDTVAVFGYLFASENWHLYLGVTTTLMKFTVPMFDMFHGTAYSVSVSFFSKFYESNEIGRLCAVSHVFNLIAPLCHPAYNIVFQKTIDFFPSAFFIVSIVLNVMVVSMYFATYFISRKLTKE